MTKTLFVSEIEGVCGGYPCVGDTRIPVRSVVTAYGQLGDFAQTMDAFPRLTREEIRYALDWYRMHPERVDEDIRRNARTLEDRQSRQRDAGAPRWQSARPARAGSGRG